MSDLRVTKLANVLVNYSLEIKPGQKFLIIANPLASELTLAVYEEAIKAGAHVYIDQPLDEAQEIFYKLASDEQLDFVSPIEQLITGTFDATLYIGASSNSRTLSGVDPQCMERNSKAYSELMKTHMERSARGELHWCVTVYPNNAYAQDAEMSLRDYTEFVYGAGMLNEDDPTVFWKALGKRQNKLVDWLKGHSGAI
ncbi:MAG: aminopeptidase, partial [Anaerolinea sp.]|nr:aminopeptidase [Anaerolinea sp.]